MQTLTKRQNQIYQFLVQHAQAYEYAPSIDEICQAMGVTSRGSMHKHIQALISSGLVAPSNGQRRGIRLVNLLAQSLDSPAAAHHDHHFQDSVRALPLLGRIAAGVPIEAIENPELVQIPSQLDSGGDCFVLTVQGDSMIDIGVNDGDWVIIEKASHAKNGDVVVALIDNCDATLKRFESSGEQIILQPENQFMQPLSYDSDRVKIQGKLVAQMRKYF